MKNLFAFFILIALSAPAFSQALKESKVPSAVKNTFEYNFKGVSEVNYQKKKGDYVVSFKENGKLKVAYITKEGAILKSGGFLASGEKIPAAAQKYIDANYKAGYTTNGSRLMKAPNGKVTYVVQVNKDFLTFDSDGKFIEKSKDF